MRKVSLCPSVLVPGTAVTFMLTLILSVKLLLNCEAANEAAAFMLAMSAVLKPALLNVESGS